MFESIKTWWSNVKAWFKNSETILLSRIEVVVGFLVAAMSIMDWSPLLSVGIDTGFTWVQGAYLGAIMFTKGIISEWARRLNTVEVNEHLFPAEVLKEVKTEVVVDLPKKMKIKEIDTAST